MKKRKLYRIGAGLLAGILAFSSVPQSFSLAAENDRPNEEMELSDLIVEDEQAVSAEPEDTVAPMADGDDPAPAPEPKPLKSITLDKTKLTMMRDTTAELNATTDPVEPDTGLPLRFVSSNEEIVKVSYSGKTATVSALKRGEATVSAISSDGNVRANCDVEVTPIPVERVDVSKNEASLTVGDATDGKVTLKMSVYPDTADYKELEIYSNHSNIAQVTNVTQNSDDGSYSVEVTGKSEGITDIIAVSVNNRAIFGRCRVTVAEKPEPLTEVKSKRSKITMFDDREEKLEVVYVPSWTNQTGVTWTVGNGGKWDYDGDGDDDECVTVNEDGVVRCIHPLLPGDSPHNVTITATSTANTSLSTDFTVTLKKRNVPAESLTVRTKELILQDGGTKQTGTVEVRIDPTISTDSTIKAVVDDTTVATVEESKVVNLSGIAAFRVTAVSPGDCVITFSAGSVSTTFPVKVEKYVAPVDSISLSAVSPVKEGAECKLTATILPKEAENTDIIWSVSDPEIASIKNLPQNNKTSAAIDADGNLTSTITIETYMVGDCKITATAAGDVKRETTIKVISGDVPAKSLTIAPDPENDNVGENPDIIYIRRGDTITFKPTVSPEGANKKVRWSSNSPDVASVSTGANSVCKITANVAGECVITAQASSLTEEDCKKSIKVEVMEPELVVEQPEDFSFTPDQQPITEAMLKAKLEGKVTFYPYSVPSTTVESKILNASDYTLTILSENGKGERPYDVKDLEKPGTRHLVISYKDGDTTYKCKEPISVTMKEFAEAKLLRVAPLTQDESEIWGVPNGTLPASLPLLDKVEIWVEGITSKVQTSDYAPIEWNTAAADYDPQITEEQEFDVYGTLVLPSYIKEFAEGLSAPIQVKAKVHVEAQVSTGKRVEAPRFYVLGGEQIKDKTAVELPYGSKIVIDSPTEEAQIYFMLDRRPDAERGVPKDEEHLYKSPLEITAKTTTIYAIAAKKGYYDSTCCECTIKLIQADPILPGDPDDREPDQVLDEDRPEGGKVPEGPWVAIQPDDSDETKERDEFLYTGTAIKPAIRVYDHTTLLTEKKDYTVSYKNNIKAGEKGAANSPCIVVKGKGNFDGVMEVTFTIKPQSIEIDNESVVAEDYIAVTYNKKEQKPNPVIYWNGKKLTKNKDFTVSDGVFTQAKQYDITVTGINNFTGKRKMTYEIVDGGVLVSKLSIAKIPDQKCTGLAITPPVVVKYKNTILKEDSNYTLQYKNNVDVGTASVIITGRGGYKGSKRIAFKIKPMANIKDAGFTMTFDPKTPVYNGEPIRPVSYTVTYNAETLKEGQDYKVSYANNDKAGTASLILTGMGRFTGTVKKNFKIQAGDLSKSTSVQMKNSFPYEKGGCKPQPVVTCGNRVLEAGKDYTLSYKNNNKIGHSATVTIKGKGSYKGTITKQFSITTQDIANLQVVASDKVYNNRINMYKTKVQVIDVNGKALVAETDYDSVMRYTYADGPKQGEQVLPSDLIPVGTRLRVEVRVTNPKNYIGTAYGTYRIIRADIAKAKVTINPQEYTGRQKKPGKREMQVVMDGYFLEDNDYEIVGYENNINQGTATVTIRGIGEYGGTKAVKFKIRKKGILGLLF